jgi:hypothetical protein
MGERLLAPEGMCTRLHLHAAPLPALSLPKGPAPWDMGIETKCANALELKDMLSDLEYSYSPVRDKVRDLREYL